MATVTTAPTTAHSELRLQMLQAAERLLAASPEHDISTRAVCEAVGVGQPVLYRLFGDKAGLLGALVDYGYQRYVARKKSLAVTADPVADLRAGWDDHIAFARENPAVYRLMFSPALAQQPTAPQAIFALLTSTLERCAEAGALAIPPAAAAQAILSANIGVALSLLVHPGIYADPELSARVRDAVFAGCLVTAPRGEQNDTARIATQLAALLRREPSSALGAEEQRLLLKWLGALGD